MTELSTILYPDIQPFQSGHLDVPGGHSLYYEQSGNKAGKPVIFLHGGPGGGTSPFHRRFFDPALYRIVLMDQRGSGRSRPHASLENNTTWDLVADIEALRQHLGIDRWLVFGGSWGSTLALSYAETHPERVSELVLRGIFLVRKKELDWFFQEGANALFPDAYEGFRNAIPEAERPDMLGAYHRRLTGRDEAVRQDAARAWSVWEASTCLLIPDTAFIDGWKTPNFADALARIETHYFVNKGFFREEDQLLKGAGRLAGIPTSIIQGRYDVICPMMTAWELKKALPEASFTVVTAGHAANDPGIARELVTATDRFGGK
jgi:proline iminopeptidase